MTSQIQHTVRLYFGRGAKSEKKLTVGPSQSFYWDESPASHDY
jgi:hypothetical protein